MIILAVTVIAYSFSLGAVAACGGLLATLFRLNVADGIYKRHVLILLTKDRKLDLSVTEPLGDGVTQIVIAVVNDDVTVWVLNRGIANTSLPIGAGGKVANWFISCYQGDSQKIKL